MVGVGVMAGVRVRWGRGTVGRVWWWWWAKSGSKRRDEVRLYVNEARGGMRWNE